MMIKASRILQATGRIEKTYSRQEIEKALEDYILEVLHQPEPAQEFKSYIQQNFGRVYHLLDDFILDEGLWGTALKNLIKKGLIQTKMTLVPRG